jgi:hypothetical protein
MAPCTATFFGRSGLRLAVDPFNELFEFLKTVDIQFAVVGRVNHRAEASISARPPQKRGNIQKESPPERSRSEKRRTEEARPPPH